MIKTRTNSLIQQQLIRGKGGKKPKHNEAHMQVAANPLKFTTQSHGGLNLILNSNTPFK